MASEPRRVLLYSLMPTQWKTMHQVARTLQTSGRLEPVVFFDRNMSNGPFERDVRACLDEGIECLDDRGVHITPARVADVTTARAWPRSLALRALHFATGGSPRLWNGVVEPLVAFPEDIAHYRERMRFVRGLLEREHIALLVLPGDSVSYDTPAWIKAAHACGVKSAIVPFSTNTPAGVAADLGLLPENDASRWFNRPLARLAPKWTYEAGARRLVRVPGGKALALHALGLDPPQPWVLHSGAADVVVADSAHVRDGFVREGLSAEHIEVVGSLGDDVLARERAHADERREALYRELGLPPGRPMILGSICDYSRYFQLGGPQLGVATSQDLIELWVKTMVEAGGHNVVLSLHPWLRFEDMQHLERFGAKIARRTIEELVPLAELFVVSVSVTVRLAIVCGVPVVNHDILRFRIGDYADAGGVFTVEEPAAFRDAVFRLARDRDFHAQAASAQARASALYGSLDGKSGERLVALFERLAG